MRFLFGFFFGAICGAAVIYFVVDERRPAPVTTNLGATVRESASDTRDAISDKLADWHLTGDDIKKDLSKGGQVVRSKASVVGERISDARIVTVVKAKLVLDRDLSAIDINVDCRNGDVVLKGKVDTPALVGRAMALALDTAGVRTVTSQLSVMATK